MRPSTKAQLKWGAIVGVIVWAIVAATSTTWGDGLILGFFVGWIIGLFAMAVVRGLQLSRAADRKLGID